MYMYMDMAFPSAEAVPDFGSISMFFVGSKEMGYVVEGNKRIRKYSLLSTDLNKLSNITNALDGSTAIAADTGAIYVLCNNIWSESGDAPAAIKQYVQELFNDVTGIDVQVVSELPAQGTKGTIYLLPHSHGTNDVYDEYIWVNQGNNTYAYEKIGNTNIDLSNYIQKVLNANNKVSKFDSNGNLISTGYELNKTVPADAVFTDTTYEDATQSVHGLMSTTDKTKLDGINIANYIPIVTNETGEVPKFKADGTLESTGFTLGKSVPANAVFTDTTYNEATTSSAGLLSSSDKTKIENLDSTYVKQSDIIVLTQSEYDLLTTKTALLYFIKEESP